MTAAPLVPSQPSPEERIVAAPPASQVVLLQAVRSYPAVSLLLSTTSAATMIAGDAAALRQQAREAARRLRAENVPDVERTVIEPLEQLVASVAAWPTGHAIAVFASRGLTLALRLPVPVRNRVVVDPTFATRDLVRALHRTPRHVVLTLTSREARLFDGVAGTLRPALRSTFPLRDAPDRDGSPRGGRQGQRSGGRDGQDADQLTFFRTVDRSLSTYLRLHPAPLVIAAGDRTLSAFTAVSTNLGRLAGTIPANVTTEPLPTLAARITPVLERYLLSRQDEALELIERRAGQRRVVAGMPSCWLAARRERPEMLAVEDELFYPARISADGDALTPATDVEHPEVVDDAVDELIELVLDRGGWVAFVEPGTLGGYDRVALTLRSTD